MNVWVQLSCVNLCMQGIEGESSGSNYIYITLIGVVICLVFVGLTFFGHLKSK